jgi:hypothetical protein
MTETTNITDRKIPLSQAPAKKKLLVAVPSAAASGVLWYVGVADNLTGMLAVLLTAYAIVGFIEILGGQSLVAAAKNWDRLAGWKQFLISVAVVVVAFVVFMYLMGVVAGIIAS